MPRRHLTPLCALCALCALCVLCVFCVLGVAAAEQQNPATFAKKGGNPEAAKVKNPVAASPASLAAGKRSYTRLCEKCHGPEGHGDGTAVTEKQPPDITDSTWEFGSTDGELFVAVHDGTSPDMEGYKERMTDTEIWNVVNYVRSLAK